MHLSNLLNKFFKIAFLLTLFFNLNQCGLYKKTDAREVPTNAKERAQKNVEEGRSIKLFGKKGGSGTFEFASSNEMWRAAIDILDFVPLSSADYGGGIVITEWYSDSGQINESVKIMVQFLSNEIRADGLKVVVYDRICENNNLNNCQTQTNQGSLSEEIKLAILKKASVYKNVTLKKRAEEYRKKKPIKNKNVKSNTE
tara:strand:- start:440 stop:1036 length:597 start_codon:yes stop_codon:yes gene_type:complete